MTSALKVLVSARELLSDEKRWTRHRYARDAAGDNAMLSGKKAVCWCLTGAVLNSPLRSSHQDIALDLIHGVVGGSIFGFNDDPTTTHADILRVLDAAIEKAQS